MLIIFIVRRIANGKHANGFMFHMLIIIEENDIEIDIRQIIIRNLEGKTFVIDWTLRRSFDCTSFFNDPLTFIKHIDFEIRI